MEAHDSDITGTETPTVTKAVKSWSAWVGMTQIKFVGLFLVSLSRTQIHTLQLWYTQFTSPVKFTKTMSNQSSP